MQAQLAGAGVRPSKRLGQNFLVDTSVLADIDKILAQVSPATVLEIGAGLGAVTEILLRHGRRVVAVEVDRRLADMLEKRLGSSDRLEIVRGDILQLDPAGRIDGGPAFVVGSLPYRFTAPILKWLIDRREALLGALVITQREVAGKITASPGREGSALGVLVRAYADTEVVRQIGRGSFYPAPEVDSTLWRLMFLDRPRFASPPESFFRVVRTLYGTRRKMIRAALRALLPADAIRTALEEAGIDETARGEELDFDELDRLAAAVGGRLSGS